VAPKLTRNQRLRKFDEIIDELDFFLGQLFAINNHSSKHFDLLVAKLLSFGDNSLEPEENLRLTVKKILFVTYHPLWLWAEVYASTTSPIFTLFASILSHEQLRR
jgi:hypothetical protein